MDINNIVIFTNLFILQITIMKYELSEDQMMSLKQMDSLKKTAKAMAETAKLMKMPVEELNVLLVHLAMGYLNGRPI